jgi:3-deoxy-manno-octulosonate cytidylyltransferase (CMP-KDO synthetase)
MQPVILIPARMSATRLPGKPMADIAGRPMIVRVLERARLAGIGNKIVVACDDERVAAAVTQSGGEAVMTRSDHPSGSDRIFEALQRLDPQKKFDVVVNLQGDMPLIEPSLIHQVCDLMRDPAVDIGSLVSEIQQEEERNNPAVVKAVLSFLTPTRARALYFTRAVAPTGEGPLYHHIGIYAYRRAALEKFVSLPPSPLEKREKLEQLRALEAGMRIDVQCCSNLPRPLGVDTPEQLAEANQFWKTHLTNT